MSLGLNGLKHYPDSADSVLVRIILTKKFSDTWSQVFLFLECVMD